MGSYLPGVALAFVVCLAVPERGSAQLSEQTDKKACQDQVERLLLNKRLVAKATFPASAKGIDLSLDGEWDHKRTSQLIKSSGGGIDIDDPAMVTQVKVKDNLLEIQLNGGGFGTFGDLMMTGEKQRKERSVAGKASGGSRINLRLTSRSVATRSRTRRR